MATVATKPMTAEEFYEWSHRPENEDKLFELERGEIVEVARTGTRHGLVCANVVGILGNFAARRKNGWVCRNQMPMVVKRDPATVRFPDALFFDDPEKFEDVDEKYGESPPRLVVEVLSPNDNVGKMNRRIREELLLGAKVVWLLDPEARNVTVYQLGQDYRVVEETEELEGGDVLPDFRCKVAEFFNLPGQ